MLSKVCLGSNLLTRKVAILKLFFLSRLQTNLVLNFLGLRPCYTVQFSQQLVSQVLIRAHAHVFCFSFIGTLGDKLLRRLHSVTGLQHQTSATCNAKFSTIARQVAEKIA